MLAGLGGIVWWCGGGYAPFTDRTGTLRLFEVVPVQSLAGQAALLGALLFIAWRYGPQLRLGGQAWLERRGTRIRGDAAAALLLLCTLGFYPRERASRTLLADGLAQFPSDLLTWAGMACLALGASVLLTGAAPGIVHRVGTLWRRVEAASPLRFAVCVGAVGLAGAVVIALVQFHGLPVATDGANYRFQANMFAHGHLTLPPPPVPAQFEYISVMLEPRWRSIANPGWSALLMVGVLAGVPWLMNPLCHGGTVVLLYALGRRWWTERTGRIAAFLGLCSPFLLLPAGSHMSHSSALFALLLFLWLWQNSVDRNGAAWALAAGVALGWAATIRPLDAAAIAFPWGVWTLIHAARGRLGIRPVIMLGLGVFAPLAALGAYNNVAHGSPTTFGYSLYYVPELRLGFVPPPDLTYLRYTHTPARGVMNANNNLNALNKILLGWPIPALALVLTALRSRERRVWDTACAASAALLFTAYFFFVHADFMYGARYYHAAAGVLLLLAARGVCVGAAALGPRATAGGVCACLAFAALGFFPPVLYYYRPEAPVFQGVQTRLHEALALTRPTHAVVVVPTGSALGYGSAFWRNGDGMTSDVVFARDDGRTNAALRVAFPDRVFYRFESDADSPRLTLLAD